MKDELRFRENRRIEYYHRLAELVEKAAAPREREALADIKAARSMPVHPNDIQSVARRARDLFCDPSVLAPLFPNEGGFAKDEWQEGWSGYWRTAAGIFMAPFCTAAYFLAEHVALDLIILF